jgi:hypothetical protein
MKRLIILEICLIVAVLMGCQAQKRIGPPPATNPTNQPDTSSSCTPRCEGKQCGPDGCGSFCGSCSQGTACNPQGICSITCTSNCSGKVCGPDGCGNMCGSCPAGTACNGVGQCTTGGTNGCLPKCTGKQCGPDGCGSLCGKCPVGQQCGTTGLCQVDTGQCGSVTSQGECQQNNSMAVWCEAGQLQVIVCDPALGLVCGYHQVKAHYDCVKAGCSPNCTGKECGADGCGSTCGTCPGGLSCNAQGICSNACITSCTGKECGADGCGGECGICAPGFKCTPAGLCVNSSGCTPQCSGKDCGSDSCGGSCGQCANGQSCDASGHCTTVAGGSCGSLTFEGECDNTGKKALWCEAGVPQEQDCTTYGPNYVCSWIDDETGYFCTDQCNANCAGKQCGSDGCGSTCGQCGEGQTCNAAGQCTVSSGGDCGSIDWTGICEGTSLKYCSGGSLVTVDCSADGKVCGFSDSFNWYSCLDHTGPCTPSCTNKVCGSDGCGGSCGTCPTGKACDSTGTCVDDVPPEGCNGLTIVGTCEGTVLKYCLESSGTLYTKDCAESNKICGWDPTGNGGDGWYDCLDVP